MEKVEGRRLVARPHVQQPSRGFPELKAKKRKALFRRGQATLLLIYHQSQSRKLALEALPRFPGLRSRMRQQHHIVRVTDEHDRMTHRAIAATLLTIHFVKHDVGKQRRNHPALGRTAVGMRHLAFLQNSRFEPSSDQAHDSHISNPTPHQL